MGFFVLLYFFIYSRESIKGDGKGRRKRETSLCGCLLHMTHLGTEPTTQPCALTRIQTCDFWFAGQCPTH